jgi:type II secretory pathway component PulF
MPVFEYKALDSDGQSAHGRAGCGGSQGGGAAACRGRACARFKIEQKHHVAQTEDAESETIDLFASERKVQGRQTLFKASKSVVVLQLFKRLLTLLSAGMSLGDATRLMQQRLSDPTLKELSGRVWKHLSEGRTLANALGAEKGLFTPAQCHLIEAGEASGNLVPVLRRMVAYLEEKQAVKKRLVASLTYPVIIIGVASLVIMIVIGFLIPQIEKMVEQLGSELFFLARWMIAGSDLALKFGPFVLVGAIVAAIVLARWRKTALGRRTTDMWSLQMPIFGTINLYSNIYATSNLMATLLGSGVNTTEALRLVERTISNVVLRSKFNAARKQIQEGVSMASAINRVHFMPDLAMDILTVGENTGDVVTSLEDINNIYREELTRRLDRLTGLIAGVALGIAFFIVAIIAFSVAFSVISVSQSLISR